MQIDAHSAKRYDWHGLPQARYSVMNEKKIQYHIHIFKVQVSLHDASRMQMLRRSNVLEPNRKKMSAQLIERP
jgi:hypothetical protein